MTPSEAPHRIAVVGGGISGLAAAYTLARARESGAPIEEFLLESSDRLGGAIRTEHADGFVIEAGPDSFLAEKPEAASLCRELGLGDSLIGSNDAARRTLILHRGRLVPLPEGLQLFLPTRLWPAITTPLLTFRGKLAIAGEWFRRRAHNHQIADESVASFIRRHFGSGMVENIADPLLAGIFGGDSNALSARSTVPRFWEMEQKYGSLTRGVLETRRQHRAAARLKPSSTNSPPLFATLQDGLGQLVNALNGRLEQSHLYGGRRVLAIERSIAGDRRLYRIRCQGGESHEADAIVLAVPAFESSRLLCPFDPDLAECLKAIPYSSALTVALGYDAGACSNLPAGFGFLVPRKENRRILACTFVHNKFCHRAPSGKILLRCFLGGTRDPEALNLSDDEILSVVRSELGAILNFSSSPLFYRIYRWPSSMPQYVVGHAERLKTIENRLKNHPGLYLAGNAYSGVGISDCIRAGRAAAERAIQECLR